ncbi:MAG TPA: ribose 5-phosphate isomerase B [Syntrophorhabdus sp.]|jgi:ribose 5-phosphate isomerase B|nr:ribose 5-phosphate isomerase B [Syntrophorhabdus sp.]MDI9559527.1 ribose 5-phosphate isomerase B [Pseudomonadota bacterium]OPX98075.1 MAG: putative sugar phosphate isomerase YwlF [Syntrophorhabdus sp. PtaB.Bin027]OQB75783.1 MAG: putative sugar phosphate isomerase YwlF [Deltaproteobacteria bacterium ADurb.Bin135]MBP8744950.1 ribose 5-phosphate isomerase B [Syntrophorhabdus sp.]
MKVVVGSDHAGYELKEQVKTILTEKGHTVIDVGTGSPASVDYPDFGIEAATLVGRGEADRGVLVCGTGIGMSIVANKVKGVRAALIDDLYSAIQSRKHLDANILVLGGRVTGRDLAAEITRVWLDTPFEGGRHSKRLEKIEKYEKDNLK